jgi:murein DD-endopeptidase MepM/ murein hydrolase activator NlpD
VSPQHFISLGLVATSFFAAFLVGQIAAANETGPSPIAPPSLIGAPVHNDAIAFDKLTAYAKLRISTSAACNNAQAEAGTAPSLTLTLAWPLKLANAGISAPYYTITNFVDLDPSKGLQDFNCGKRTYDGHTGADIVTSPGTWQAMDQEDVMVIAARAGTLIESVDGYFDRSCAVDIALADAANHVILQHDDGTFAYYWHLKKGSVLTESIGSRINVGDFLGFIGSSGYSSKPHLHFEVRDASNKVVEPFTGTCNNSTSLWIKDEGYVVPQILRLDTTSISPNPYGLCGSETLNSKAVFNPGDRVSFVAYLRDFEIGKTITWRVIDPSWTIFSTDTFTNSSQFYSESYWQSINILGSAPRLGTWTFQFTFNGQTAERTFVVAAGSTNVPGPPTAITATPGDGSTNVAFSAPTTNGGLPITGYTVTSMPGRLTADGQGSPIAVRGLSNGKAYSFTVKARNSLGAGADSAGSFPQRWPRLHRKLDGGGHPVRAAEVMLLN